MKTKLFSLVLFAFFAPFLSNAQWQLLEGPNGVHTTNLVQFQNIWYAATSVGLIESNDQGEHWAYTNQPFNTHLLSNLSADNGKMLFKRTYHLNAYLTTDSGATWTTITPDTSFQIVDIKISGSKIYAHCSYNAFYISNDDGTSWNQITLPSQNNLEVMEIYEGRLYLSFSNNGTGQGGLFFSDDDGQTWTPSPTTGISGASSYLVASVYRYNNLVFLLNYDGLYKSTDTGNTWASFSSGIPSTAFTNPTLSRMTVAGGKIYFYANLRKGLYVSDTATASFSNQSTNLPLESTGTQIVEVGDTVYAPTSGGLYKASKNNFNWQFCGKGINYYFTNVMRTSGSNLYMGSSDGFSVSNDNGYTFNHLASATDTRSIFVNSSEVVASAAYGYRTTNSGNTWTDLNFPYGYYSQQMVDYCSNSQGMIALNIDGTLKSSSNGGTSWSTLTFPAGTPITLGASTNSYFIASMSGLYRSPVLGGMWSQVLSGQQISKILFDSGILYAINNTGGFIWYSTNDGLTWNDMHYPAVTFQSATVYNGVLIVSPTMKLTFDNGISWYDINIPLPNNQYPELVALNSDYLFVTHADSLYRLSSALLNGINSISQNSKYRVYPSPAKDVLNIELQNSPSGFNEIEIQIMNLSGQVLFSNSYSESEIIQINLSEFPAGILQIELKQNKQTEHFKFVHVE
ncbi:MAG: T9SS type A sorting domain-containing protein [Bacteroidetes bacterium]|nr:T9SS type A sorting domain-containing protein [Bacteroidota bacterium]